MAVSPRYLAHLAQLAQARKEEPSKKNAPKTPRSTYPKKHYTTQTPHVMQGPKERAGGEGSSRIGRRRKVFKVGEAEPGGLAPPGHLERARGFPSPGGRGKGRGGGLGRVPAPLGRGDGRGRPRIRPWTGRGDRGSEVWGSVIVDWWSEAACGVRAMGRNGVERSDRSDGPSLELQDSDDVSGGQVRATISGADRSGPERSAG